MTKTEYVKRTLARLSWGQRGICERCGKDTTSGTLVRLGPEDNDLWCYLCTKKDIGDAWDAEYTWAQEA